MSIYPSTHRPINQTGKPDSYAVVTYAGQAFKTKVVDDSEDPAYNEDIISCVDFSSLSCFGVALALT